MRTLTANGLPFVREPSQEFAQRSCALRKGEPELARVLVNDVVPENSNLVGRQTSAALIDRLAAMLSNNGNMSGRVGRTVIIQKSRKIASNSEKRRKM